MSNFVRRITTPTGHVMFVKRVTREELPEGLRFAEDYTTFYVVKNHDDGGRVFFYLAKGHRYAPKEIVGWYRSGAFWSSYGLSLEAAITGMQRDAWLYA